MSHFLKKAIILSIKSYQKTLSPDTGLVRHLFPKRISSTCMYYPSCSEYTVLAVEKYGPIKGLFMGAKRVISCRPGKDPAVDFP